MSTSFGENVFAKDVLKRTAAAIPGLWAPRQGDLHARSGSASTAHSQDMSHPERNGAAIADSLVDAEISGEEGIRVDWEIDPMVFARCNLNLRLRQVLCFVCTIVKSVFACVANSPTPHLDVFSIYRLMDKLMVLIWNTMQ